jgi:hypothetical protein
MADKPQISELVILAGKPDTRAGVTAAGLKAPLRAAQIQKSVASALKRVVPDGLGELVQRKPGALLERPALDKLLKDRDIVVLYHHVPGAPVVLSARTAFVENHGYLNFILPRFVSGENGQAWFLRTNESEDYRKVEVWLTDLTVGASYLVQLRVTSGPDSSFEVRGSDTTGVQTVHGGYQLTIPVLVHEVHSSMSLVTVANHDDHSWGFYDATITAL